MTFDSLNLIEPILRSIKTEGYTTPTPIQEQAIPIVLEGKDLLGCAQTGTGKTAAFAIPILQLLVRATPHAAKNEQLSLIFTPTRELAIQIGESFNAYGRHTGLDQHTVIFGGVNHHSQTDSLHKTVWILLLLRPVDFDRLNEPSASCICATLKSLYWTKPTVCLTWALCTM